MSQISPVTVREALERFSKSPWLPPAERKIAADVLAGLAPTPGFEPVAWRWKDTSDSWLYSETEPALLIVGRLNEVQPLYALSDTSTDRRVDETAANSPGVPKAIIRKLLEATDADASPNENSK